MFLQKAFIDQTKKIVKGSSTNGVKYWQFLDSEENAQNVNHFCMKIFQALTNSNKEQHLDDYHEAMFSTLLILQFYKNTKGKSDKWIEDSKKMLEQNRPKLFQNGKWILKLYIQNSQQAQFAMNFLSSICHIPEKFSWKVEPGQQILESLQEAREYFNIIEFKKKDKPYKKLSHLSYPDTLKQSKIISFAYCCFLDYLKSCSFQVKKKIWSHLLNNVKGLIHAYRFAAESYELLIIMIHMISILIKFCGCLYEDILKELLFNINILRKSPGRLSDLSEELFFIVHGQLKFPGSAFRKQIKRRFVNIDSKKAQDLGSRKYFVSSRKINYSVPEYCSLTNLRKLIIYNVLASCKLPNIASLWNSVQPLDAETTFAVYFKIMRIIEIATNLQSYENIQNLIRQSVNELLLGTTIGQYKLQRKEEEEQLHNLIKSQHIQKIFEFPNFQILHIKFQSFMSDKYEYSFVELIKNLRQIPYNEFFYTNYLDIIFLGNDQELGKILNQLCPFLLTLPAIQYQKFAFYVLPCRQGTTFLAEYVSCKDIWYRRFIYNVFKEKIIFPYIHMEDPQIKDTFPNYLYEKSLQMYLREAQLKVPFQVYKCLVEFSQTKEVKTIYFINNLLMGASMMAELMKSEVKKEKKSFLSSSTSSSVFDGLQTYLQKIKTVSPIAIDISVRYQSPKTKEYVTKDEKVLLVEDLQICNTPKCYFFGYKPNPLAQCIQLSILTASSAKIFKSEVDNRQNFKRYSDSEINQAFKDLFINMTAQTIIITRSDGLRQPLKMLIDGKQVGGIQKMQIQPAYLDNKLPCTLPVRCFLPFQT